MHIEDAYLPRQKKIGWMNYNSVIVTLNVQRNWFLKSENKNQSRIFHVVKKKDTRISERL